MVEKHYTPKELSEMISISRETLIRWRRNGKGPRFKKLGRRVFYTESDLKNFLSASKISSSKNK